MKEVHVAILNKKQKNLALEQKTRMKKRTLMKEVRSAELKLKSKVLEPPFHFYK